MDMASDDKQAASPEAAPVAKAHVRVSHSLFVPDKRSLGLNDATQKRLMEAIEADAPEHSKVKLTKITHVIGQGFTVNYTAAPDGK